MNLISSIPSWQDPIVFSPGVSNQSIQLGLPWIELKTEASYPYNTMHEAATKEMNLRVLFLAS